MVKSSAGHALSRQDRRFMEMALVLAGRGLGRVWPNPSVGCVIVRASAPAVRVVGRGVTAPGGRPHAETEALAVAGEAARGATAYVSFEPCAHQGKTGPCAQALIDAGIVRVVSAMTDPDPRVSGNGHAILKGAGVAVETGLMEAEARALNIGFLCTVEKGRPAVTLKLATSLDGMIAAKNGASKWITGEVARAEAHALRARHDAVLVGVGTVLADDPRLTCRLPGLEDRSPVRVVLDTHMRLPLTSGLVKTARAVPTWVLTGSRTAEAEEAPYRRAGMEILHVPQGRDGKIDLGAALSALGKRGLTRILVEGGAGVAASLVREGLVDRLVWFRAPIAMGGDGVAAFGPLELAGPSGAPRFILAERRPMGEDLMEIYAPAGNER